MTDLDEFIAQSQDLCSAVIEVGRYADGGVVDDERVFTAYAAMEEARQILAVAQGTLAARLAESMGDKRLTVEGVGTFEKHRKTDRKAWDKDLVHRVLDTRVVDDETGEVLDETPVAKVLAVWNLGAPRVTALRERGIDPDEWCSVEYGGLTLQVIR